jgi:hypothetical protein
VNNELSALVEGVLAEAERIGLAPTTIKYYRCCCPAVVGFCLEHGIERLTVRAVDEFRAAMDERARRGEIGPSNRSTLEKTARMMLEFQQTGAIDWHRRRPPEGVSASDAAVIGTFAASVRDAGSGGPVTLIACPPGLRTVRDLSRVLAASRVEQRRRSSRRGAGECPRAHRGRPARRVHLAAPSQSRPQRRCRRPRSRG